MHLKKIHPFLTILSRHLKMENRFQFMIITVKKLYCMFLPLGEQDVVRMCPCGTLAQSPFALMVELKSSESFKNNIQTAVDCSCSGIRWIGPSS